jgi:transcriptional regulator
VYTPAHYTETRPEVMHRLIGAHPLGALVLHGPGGLDADHIVFESVPPTPEMPLGALRGHVARANPVWQRAGAQVMVLFQGESAYVSPASMKRRSIDGKVVPTWDYAVVHAHGKLRVLEDPQWLLALLGQMTDRYESPQARPWTIDEAPRDYIGRMLEAVVGVEIVIERLHGKWKTRPGAPSA